jgi:penicillin amidase
MKSVFSCRFVAATIGLTLWTAAFATAVRPAAAAEPLIPSAAELARNVTIYRDSYGTPHIDAKDDISVVFGFAYAQAEDYFWQIEDTYILALGR